MAVRFDASGDILKRTANLPATSAFTACGWARFVSIRAGQYQYFIELANGTSNAGSYLIIGYRSGTAFEISTGNASASFASAPTTGTWFFWALTHNNTNLVGYWAHAGSALVTQSITGQSFTPAQLSIGNDTWNEWCDIEMSDTLIYDAVLTQAELEQQMYRSLPVRTANLNIWSPLPSASDIVDYSGNGRDWTSGGTLTSASGPPLSWGAKPWVVPFVAAGGTTYNQSAAGTLTPAGATSKRAAKVLAGTLTTAGALAKRAGKTLAGTLTTAGALTRRAAKVLAGTLTTAGTLATIRLYIKAVGGTLTTAGALARRSGKALAGTLTTAGALTRRTGKVVTGTLTTAGALTRRTAKAIAGALTTAGSLATSYIPGSVTFSQAVGGTLTTAGALARRTNKAVGGTLTTAGALARRTAKALAGALTAAGSLATSFVSGSVTFSQAVGGTLTTAGALARRTDKALAGTLTAAGALARRTAKTFAGTLTTAGGVLRNLFSPSAAKLDVTLADARVYTCSLTDARVHTCSLTDALTYRVTLGDATV
jgi:hypothetical protein